MKTTWTFERKKDGRIHSFPRIFRGKDPPRTFVGVASLRGTEEQVEDYLSRGDVEWLVLIFWAEFWDCSMSRRADGNI